MGHVDSSHVQDGNPPLKLNRMTLFPSVAPISAQTYPVFSFFFLRLSSFYPILLCFCSSVCENEQIYSFQTRKEKQTALHLCRLEAA